MLPPSLTSILLAVLALRAPFAQAASDEKKPDVIPCTAKSPNTNGFYDLRPLAVQLHDPKKKLGKQKTDSWQSRGHDYKGNFSINICAPVVEEIEDVVGVEEARWRNVSAFYEADGKVFSIGEQSSGIMFRGRKLVLQYTGGSPCGSAVESRSEELEELDDDGYPARTLNGKVVGSNYSSDKDEDKPQKPKKPLSTKRRKSTLISFYCEKDPLKSGAVVSFIGTDPDECAYFFEMRSEAACPGLGPVQAGLGPAGVFGIIAIIAVLVYFIGGVMYNRSVEHSRGWKQLPNYAMWAGIGGFFMDFFTILTSSCARCLPGRRGYNSLPGLGNGSVARGMGRPDDENRLIDQLDEEWDD
ncbi:Cation-independent mannose-6-phosphate receptor CI-MPR [Pseudogymnoascus destructans]|uniref:MRH domain-containing protein n=2 Tax=Pseudogymnoascus destructans TaxID=655981 RepID=L8GAH1_PSED2|nr:Cation-independent mannose-6-phosphate receptor CI-MPR [Pseudogymnoascus destructans]ELR10072.1 hypothetical protein GMDG_04473 [Pseudogymnoascus destructans 20631-21]OAF54583.1 Cation-independent mannose-6-phosphate receptor CI-MPR [Pseudogymnoascus destructans]